MCVFLSIRFSIINEFYFNHCTIALNNEKGEKHLRANYILILFLFLPLFYPRSSRTTILENRFQNPNLNFGWLLSYIAYFQDPYHGPGQAMGLSFLVPEGVKVPSILSNIFKELKQDLGYSIHQLTTLVIIFF